MKGGKDEKQAEGKATEGKAQQLFKKLETTAPKPTAVRNVFELLNLDDSQ